MLYQIFGCVPALTRQFVPFVQGARSWFTYDVNFSVMQRLHLFVTFKYGLVRPITFQVTANTVVVSFRDQMCLLNLVAFLLFSFLNEAVWFRNLVLNWFAVSPMYVSFLMALPTVAW